LFVTTFRDDLSSTDTFVIEVYLDWVIMNDAKLEAEFHFEATDGRRRTTLLRNLVLTYQTGQYYMPQSCDFRTVPESLFRT